MKFNKVFPNQDEEFELNFPKLTKRAKIAIAIVGLILFCLMLTSCCKEPQAEIKINNFEQSYYPASNEYGMVTLCYDIYNVGYCDIDRCDVTFKVYLRDSLQNMSDTLVEDESLCISQSEHKHFYFDVSNDKRVVQIDVDNFYVY